MQNEVFSKAVLTPTDVHVGDTVEFVITLTIGEDYTGDASRLVFDFPGEVGMSRPSRMHQEDYGYVQAYISNPQVDYDLRIWDMEIMDFATKEKSSWRGMGARMAVLELGAGLTAGDTVELHWGDTGGGYGSGCRVTHVAPCPDYEDIIHVRYFQDADAGLPDLGRSFFTYERPTPDVEVPLSFRIRSKEAKELRLIRRVDKAMLLPLDMFSNVDEEAVLAELVEEPPQATTNSFHVFEIADKNVQIVSRSLACKQAPTMDNVFEGKNIYWGDIHTHSAFSNDCIEREKMSRKPGDQMAFARQRAGLDFFACTDHHEPHHLAKGKYKSGLTQGQWEETVAQAEAHTEEGVFLAMPGCEYRCPRGDTALVFADYPPFDAMDCEHWTDVREVWKDLKGHDYLSIAHFHNGGSLPAGEWWEKIEEGVEPVLEIFSCHGSYERPDALEHATPLVKSRRPDRYGDYFLKRGLRYGFVCNSDGHKGHVGSNGITAVYCEELTKSALFEAYRQRHVYGTTNARIRLLFTGNGALMGSVVPNTSTKNLHINVTGEAPLKKIDIFRNGDFYQRIIPDGLSYVDDLVVEDDEASFWYVRATQLDNHIAWSSPVFFE